MRRLWLVAAAACVAAPGALVAAPVFLVLSAGGGKTAAASGCAGQSLPAFQVATAGLTAEQRTNAATIISVGAATLGTQAEIVAVAASYTEASLINNPGGDLDSAGLFQMRPSQGWGTYAQVTDPVYAATKFYATLNGVPGWAALPPGVAEQAVERSAFPGRYAANVPLATAIVTGATTAATAAGPAGGCVTIGLPEAIPTAAAAAIAAAPAEVQVAIAYAAAQLGKPYQWGATGPDRFDCSGLTEKAYEAAGIEITRTTYTQVAQGQPVVSEADLLPGDLVFPFADLGHVVMYLGAGYVIQAPQTGQNVDILPFYGMAGGARRVVG